MDCPEISKERALLALDESTAGFFHASDQNLDLAFGYCPYCLGQVVFVRTKTGEIAGSHVRLQRLEN